MAFVAQISGLDVGVHIRAVALRKTQSFSMFNRYLDVAIALACWLELDLNRFRFVRVSDGFNYR